MGCRQTADEAVAMTSATSTFLMADQSDYDELAALPTQGFW